MFLLINYSTRSNNRIDEDFKEINNIKKLKTINNVNRIDNINNIYEKKLLFLSLSNSRFLRYYKCVSY